MICELLGFEPVMDQDLPSEAAPDLVLVRWLERHLRRCPSWLEVLELRSLLRSLARRRVRWAWWRRLRPLRLPGRGDLVADFLASLEGQFLLRTLDGCMAALTARLELPDPFEGFDGRHPTARRPSRLERLHERIGAGAPVPPWVLAEAVTAYGSWKVTGVPVLAAGLMPEMTEFLAPAHAAAINAMSPAAVLEAVRRLRAARCSDAGCRAVLRELDQVGAEATRRWPGIDRRCATPPLGLWPVPEEPGATDDPPAAPAPTPGLKA